MTLEKKKSIAYFIYGLVLVGSLAYIWASWFGIPVWRYFPVLDIWNLGKISGETSMGYYGKFFLVIPIALIGAIIIFLLAKFTSLFSGSRSEDLIFGSASSGATFIALIYYIGHEGTSYIVNDAGVDAVLHAIIWAIVLLGLLFFTLIVTKTASKAVFEKSEERVI